MLNLKDHISVTSRILVAFASGALIAVYFLPAWRIDLFAPQYPEGLTMYIWINKLTGDVDIINGLNHYIGMKHISASMFPEFKFLPYVVAFFLLLGMTAAITGKRTILLIYVIFTFIGGILVPYDLYMWGYRYGHELDPNAAIQVPGLSYQPPVFGHKRLLNFDAYSFPDIAGWIVVGAGLLATLVLIIEWIHYKKYVRKIAYTTVLIPLLFMSSILFSSCSTKPEPFAAGKDACYTCKMGIADLKYGGELITNKGKVYKFDDLGCMIGFLRSGTVTEKEINQILTMNFESPNSFLNAKESWFVTSQQLKSPMNSNTAGFLDKAAGEKLVSEKSGVLRKWDELYDQLK